MIGDCMSSGNRWTGAAMVCARPFPAEHELMGAF